MFKISECNDYIKLSRFFYDNGLEVEPGMEKPDSVVKCWECINADNHRLVGGASLEIRDSVYVVADVAVDSEYRQSGIGSKLMDIVEEEIVKLGGDEAWLVGKVPGFYSKRGWVSIIRKNAPDISRCFDCEMFGNECKPEIMKKTFAKKNTP